MMSGKRFLEGIVLYSKDRAKAKAFYWDVLGLPLMLEEEHVVHFDAGSVRVAIHEGDADAASDFGFLTIGVDDIEATVRDLQQRGAQFQRPIQDKPYGRVAYLNDPDGHLIGLWQLPREGPAGPVVERYQRAVAKLLG